MISYLIENALAHIDNIAPGIHIRRECEMLLKKKSNRYVLSWRNIKNLLTMRVFDVLGKRKYVFIKDNWSEKIIIMRAWCIILLSSSERETHNIILYCYYFFEWDGLYDINIWHSNNLIYLLQEYKIIYCCSHRMLSIDKMSRALKMFEKLIVHVR